MFWFKKTLGPLLFPIPLILFLMGIGLVVLWRGRRSGLARILLTSVFAALMLLSCGPLADQVLRPLEDTFPAFDPALHAGEPVAWVVVLGGGVVDDPALPHNSQLGQRTMSRTIEGVRIARLYPEARLVVSGGAVYTTISEASAMAGVARLCGVDSARIVLDAHSRDTKDQARTIAALVGTDRLVLVTSASHLPRAMAMFRKQGLDPIPAPTDYNARRGTSPLRLTEFYPSSQNIQIYRQIFYESLGRLWAALRGQV